MLNNNIVESYKVSDSAAADMSCCLCACRAPSGAPLFAGFICRKNNVRNAVTCQRRRYHSIKAAVLPRLPLFSWFKVWNMTPVQSTDWTITWFWTLKSNRILSQPALATKWVLIIPPKDSMSYWFQWRLLSLPKVGHRQWLLVLQLMCIFLRLIFDWLIHFCVL